MKRRRSRRVDWLLLATLLLIYAVMQVAGSQAHLAAGERTLSFRISGCKARARTRSNVFALQLRAA